MSIFKLAWRNIVANPLQLVLNLILFALGIGLIHFLVSFNAQLKNKFDNNLAGIDMVLGAKGSALQLILCNMYHVDNPTGNISIADAKPFLNPNHPLISLAIPLSTGDSYKGYRIIGTEHAILDLYQAELSSGRIWFHNLEAVVGSNVASKLGLKIGDQFTSSHGFEDIEDFEHEHSAFEVTGILAQSGTVLDQLILCNSATVWEVHDHDEEGGASEDHAEHDHAGHDHEGHDHSGHDHHDHDHHGHDHHNHHDHSGHDHSSIDERGELLANLDKEITAILVKFKNRKSYQALSMPRQIRENTALMTASPAYEINKLFDMIGIGTKALRMLAYLIALVSFVSIFISLLNALKSRKYELALIRVAGASPGYLLRLILLEGMVLAFLGYLIGITLSYLGSFLMSGRLSETYQYNFASMYVHPITYQLLLAALVIGLLAALLPAYLAYKTNIHETLSAEN